MAIEIDGLSVLRAITASPDLFPDAGPEINNFARKLVGGQLKPAATNLERLRNVYRAIGGEAFVLILDGQPACAALLKKLDKDNQDVKSASPDWMLRRICLLASGDAEPDAKTFAPASGRTKASGGAKKVALTSDQQQMAGALKNKAVDLERVRVLWREAGEVSFTLVLGTLTERQRADLAKRLDKDNPDLKLAAPDWHRQRVIHLAKGAAEPIFKNIMESKAMVAKRKMPPKAN